MDCLILVKIENMKTIIDYKGYIIETRNGSSFIYLPHHKNAHLAGCTHSDLTENNSEMKAKLRIDSGKINLLKTK